MDALFTKQSAAIASLSVALANTLVAFGLVNAIIAAASQAFLAAGASLVLASLHCRDTSA